MKFKEMPYKRPDPEAIKKGLQDFTERLKNASSYEEAKATFLAYEDWYKIADTTATLAYVRQSIDTRDEFYSQEKDFWDEIGPEIEEVEQEWIEALLKSPFRKDFERDYGELLFLSVCEPSATYTSQPIIGFIPAFTQAS